MSTVRFNLSLQEIIPMISDATVVRKLVADPELLHDSNFSFIVARSITQQSDARRAFDILNDEVAAPVEDAVKTIILSYALAEGCPESLVKKLPAEKTVELVDGKYVIEEADVKALSFSKAEKAALLEGQSYIWSMEAGAEVTEDTTIVLGMTAVEKVAEATTEPTEPAESAASAEVAESEAPAEANDNE